MKNVLMILFLTFSFQLTAAENERAEDSGRSPNSTLGERDESMIDCSDHVDANRRSDAQIRENVEAEAGSSETGDSR